MNKRPPVPQTLLSLPTSTSNFSPSSSPTMSLQKSSGSRSPSSLGPIMGKKKVVFFFWPQACTSWWSLSSLWNITSLLEIFLYYHKLVLRISIWFQKLPVCMRIITTTKNAWNATVVAWICLVPIKNEREDSKIKFFAISILRIWLWWRVQISCSSLETSSLKVWDVLWLEGKAPPRLFFRFPLKLAQVF